MTIESMGASQQVEVLDQLAETLKDVVAAGAPIDRDQAILNAAGRARVPYSQMKYVLTYALNQGIVKQDRVAALLTA